MFSSKTSGLRKVAVRLSDGVFFSHLKQFSITKIPGSIRKLIDCMDANGESNVLQEKSHQNRPYPDGSLLFLVNGKKVSKSYFTSIVKPLV